MVSDEAECDEIIQEMKRITDKATALYNKVIYRAWRINRNNNINRINNRSMNLCKLGTGLTPIIGD